MTPKINLAEYVGDYTIRVGFVDGTQGEIDLKDELWGEVFEPLKKQELFRDFRIEKELNTISWPTGADLAPEFLYESAKSHPTNEAATDQLQTQ